MLFLASVECDIEAGDFIIVRFFDFDFWKCSRDKIFDKGKSNFFTGFERSSNFHLFWHPQIVFFIKFNCAFLNAATLLPR